MNIDLRTSKNKHETNPFILELKGKMYLQPRANAVIAKGEIIVDGQTGEILKENVIIGRRKIVDKSQFAKIYATEISMLYELSKPAMKVFLHLSKIMDYENKAYINTEKDYNKIGYKTALSITKGLKELIQKNIIAPSVMPGWYWLNPAIVCKGERFAKYTEYLTEEEARREEKALIAKQGVRLWDSLPADIEEKYKR